MLELFSIYHSLVNIIKIILINMKVALLDCKKSTFLKEEEADANQQVTILKLPNTNMTGQ